MLLSLVIPTIPARRERLAALLGSIAQQLRTAAPFEIVLVVDETNEEPIQAARRQLPTEIALIGLTQSKSGPAAARNLGVQAARGGWLLFLDDDMLLGEGLIAAHQRAIASDPQAHTAWLGPVDPPPQKVDSAWQRLCCESPMTFFPHDARAELDFRYFWSGHISVQRELVLEAGGFDARFPNAMHEDIELGFRLQERCGVKVRPLAGAVAWHDHVLSVRDYLVREHRSGASAAAARTINRAFHDRIWAYLADAAAARDCLQKFFTLAAKQAAVLLGDLEKAPPLEITPAHISAAYLAHLPLKRLTFLQGYCQTPLEAWLNDLAL